MFSQMSEVVFQVGNLFHNEIIHFDGRGRIRRQFSLILNDPPYGTEREDNAGPGHLRHPICNVYIVMKEGSWRCEESILITMPVLRLPPK